MNNLYKMTDEEKIEMMSHVGYMLSIVRDTMLEGLNHRTLSLVDASDDEFLKFGYMLIVNGIDPDANKVILQNLVINEINDFERKKKRIQMEAILAIQHKDALNKASLIILSYFGLAFRSEFIRLLNNYDKELCETIFTGDEFHRYNIDNFLKI